MNGDNFSMNGEGNITKPEWRHKEAAMYAFGSILEGPSVAKLAPVINSALGFMLNALTTDPDSHVKATTAWTLGRIFELLHGSTTQIITPSSCQQIITVLLQSMNDSPNVAEKACGALYFLVQGYEDGGSSSPLTSVFLEIVKSLLTVTNATESRLRSAAYKTLNEVVRCSTEEVAPLVLESVPLIMAKLCHSVEAHKAGCLNTLIQKFSSSEPLKASFQQFVDQVLLLYQYTFSLRRVTLQELSMASIGVLAYAVGSAFVSYMPEICKYLEQGLQNVKEYKLCAVTVKVLGDISRVLKEELQPHYRRIMDLLLHDLVSNELHRSVKPLIFTCLGDFALAVKVHFADYFYLAVPVILSYAASASREPPGAYRTPTGTCYGDAAFRRLYASYSTFALPRPIQSLMPEEPTSPDDEMLFINLLRKSIMDAYSGLYQGLFSPVLSFPLSLLVPFVLHFVDCIYACNDTDDEAKETALRLLAVLASTVGGISSFFKQSPSCNGFVNECLTSSNPAIRDSAVQANKKIMGAIMLFDLREYMNGGSSSEATFPF